MEPSMTTAAKKPTKLERLTEQLAKARARLEAERPALEAEIDVWDTKQQRLRKTYDASSLERRRLYEVMDELRDAAWKSYESTIGGHDQLVARLTTWCAGRGLAHANTIHLANELIRKHVDALPEIVAAAEAHHKQENIAENDYRRYNVFTNRRCVARDNLDLLKKTVSDLEKEICRTPDRNEIARIRRAEEKQALLESEQTATALAALDEFVLDKETP